MALAPSTKILLLYKTFHIFIYYWNILVVVISKIKNFRRLSLSDLILLKLFKPYAMALAPSIEIWLL